MRRLLLALILILICQVLVFGFDWKNISLQDRKLIKKAVAVYSALHNTNYQVVTTKTISRLGQLIKIRELRVAGQVFRWEYSIAEYKRKLNTIYISAGNGLNLSYSRYILSWLSIQAGAGYFGSPLYYFGAGVSF